MCITNKLYHNMNTGIVATCEIQVDSVAQSCDYMKVNYLTLSGALKKHYKPRGSHYKNLLHRTASRALPNDHTCIL